MVERVTAATIFGESRVAVIRLSGFIKNNVFHNRAKANGVPDNGFVLLAEIDGFCIATAFDIENGARCPSVLIVTNQIARGSAESVVLPVPDSPKNSVVSPSSPILAEQCMGSTSFSGKEVLH